MYDKSGDCSRVSTKKQRPNSRLGPKCYCFIHDTFSHSYLLVLDGTTHRKSSYCCQLSLLELPLCQNPQNSQTYCDSPGAGAESSASSWVAYLRFFLPPAAQYSLSAGCSGKAGDFFLCFIYIIIPNRGTYRTYPQCSHPAPNRRPQPPLHTYALLSE